MSDPPSMPADDALGQRLIDERPLPPAGFSGELRRHLSATVDHGPRPPRLRLLITVSAAAGLLALIICLLWATGAL